MKRKFISSLVTVTSITVLAACASSQTKETTSSSTKETTKTSTTKSITTTKASATSSSAKNGKESKSASSFSGKTYADTENMEFAINGKVYRLGETTLQTLMDDGVPFEADSINNAGNNVNPNSQSDTFKIVLGDYWNLQIWTANFTEEGKSAKDLPISEIYYPHKQDETQNVLTFNFPMDITLDSLKANAGEPTKLDHYDGGNGFTTDRADYRYESSQYLSEGGYSFEFTKGQFSGVKISYIPR